MAQVSYGTITITDTTDAEVKLKYFWHNLTESINYPAGTYMASGINNELIENDPSTYGFNSLQRNNQLAFRYNSLPLTTIGLDGLKLYAPILTNNIITNSQLGVELTADALKFYGLPINGRQNVDAQLNANGLILQKGGIISGEPNQTGFVYLSSDNYVPGYKITNLESNDNPSTLGLYELVNNEYVLTSDTSPISDKIYYIKEIVTINGHSENWREIIGTKFGVDADGNLYASNAEISGKITVGSGSNVYTKTEANGAFDALGAADTAESNAVATAAADATSKANAAQAAAEAAAAQDATAKANAVNTALETYKTATNSTLNSLQDQVDGQVEVWYYSIDPTNSNSPASSWDTDTLKARHEGDLYYNINNGHSWRWLKNGSTYSWQQIPDGDAAAALAKATEALGLAGDKRRIFTAQPIPPYDVGDLWADGSQIKYCSISKSEGQSYAATDWTLTATDDTKANSAAYEEQYIYISKVSGTGSVTKYETWVTRSDDVQNIWTTKRPTYDSSYPVLFIAKQKKTVGQSSGITCSCTTPVKDDTVTVIDGGHITTGTIDASRLSVYDATINKISASAIDVSSIQIGQSQVNNLTNDLSNKASINAEYSVNIVTSNFNPTATGTDTFITLTAKVSRVDGTAVGTISYAWYGDNSSTAISGATSASYNVPANLVWNGTTGYKTFTVQVN